MATIAINVDLVMKVEDVHNLCQVTDIEKKIIFY